MYCGEKRSPDDRGGEVAHAVDDDELARRLEVAGVARVHPALAQIGARRVLVLVVALEHVGMLADDLADALRVGIVDLDLVVVVEAAADGVEIDLAAALNAVDAAELGLAVELQHGQAHGHEELEGVGAHRCAAGAGEPQPREAQPIAQRAQHQGLRQPARAPALDRLQPALHTPREHPPLEARSIHDLGAHVGGDLLPHARRQEHEGRRDLPEIGHDRVGFLDEVELVAAHQRLIEGLELLADPTHRQQARRTRRRGRDRATRNRWRRAG